jgi:hypothetical protein
LAQFAGLSNNSISKVFAFDSSPITGSGLIAQKALRTNVQGLTIDRVYQDDQILGYLSPLQQYPRSSSTSGCDPYVRTVEVNAFSGNAIQLHGMAPLAQNFVQISYDQRDLNNTRPVSPAGCRYQPHGTTEVVAMRSSGGALYASAHHDGRHIARNGLAQPVGAQLGRGHVAASSSVRSARKPHATS